MKTEHEILAKICVPFKFKEMQEHTQLKRGLIFSEIIKLNLLDLELYNNILEMVTKSEEIRDKLSLVNTLVKILDGSASVEEIIKLQKSLEGIQLTDQKKLLKWNSRAKNNNKLKAVVIKIMPKINNQIQEASSHIANWGAKFRSHYKLRQNIITTDHAIMCKCGFLSIDLKLQICPLCNNSLKKGNHVPVSYLHNDIIALFLQNMWLEEGVARIFREKNFETKTRLHIMGKSNIEHEIDVVAYRKNGFLLAECTTQDLDLNKVRYFVTKMIDTQAIIGIFISTGNVEPEAYKYGSVHNVITFGNVLINIEKFRDLIVRVTPDIK